MDQVRYFKIDCCCPQIVIYEVDEEGNENFRQQDTRENTWSLFVPSEDERAAARSFREEANKPLKTRARRITYIHGVVRIDWTP